MSGSPRPDLRARWVLAAVLVAAWLHALFYAVVEPPWSLVNEVQHLDYVLTLRDTGRPPDIREPVRPDVMAAVRESRWKPPAGADATRLPAPMGRGGRSYEGYQPPMYYALMTPLAAAAGTDPTRAMWAIRLVCTLFLPLLGAVAWSLAGRWFPEHGTPVRAGAALAVATVPVAASSASRVTNDGLVTVLVAAGVLAGLRLIERPTPGRAGALGTLVAAAALTKSSGAILLAPVALVLGFLWWRARLSRSILALVLVPAVAGAGLWAAWNHARYGVADGTYAFLTVFGPAMSAPPSLGAVLRDLWWNAWVAPPVWRYHLGAAQGLAMSLLTTLVVVGAVGLVWRGPPGEGPALTAALAAAALTVVVTGSFQGVAPPVGRIALGAYPALAALTAGGWARLAGGRGALALAAVAGLVAALYDVVAFAATVRPWWFR